MHLVSKVKGLCISQRTQLKTRRAQLLIAGQFIKEDVVYLLIVC